MGEKKWGTANKKEMGWFFSFIFRPILSPRRLTIKRSVRHRVGHDVDAPGVRVFPANCYERLGLSLFHFAVDHARRA